MDAEKDRRTPARGRSSGASPQDVSSGTARRSRTRDREGDASDHPDAAPQGEEGRRVRRVRSGPAGLPGDAGTTDDGEARRALQALTGALQQFHPDLNIRPLARSILHTAAHHTGADRGVLFLGWESEASWIPVLTLDLRSEELVEAEQVGRSLVDRGHIGEIVVVEDAMDDPDLREIEGVQSRKIRSALSAPLRDTRGTFGVLYLDSRRPGAFLPRARLFLEAFAPVAAAGVEHARIHGEVRREVANLRRLSEARSSYSQLILQTPRTAPLLERARMAAHVDQPILIIGEPGTEKEMLARMIFDGSIRSTHPFISGSCSTVLRDRLEEYLFGRVTTAGASFRSGLVEDAHRGVLFLDEIGQAGLPIQRRLHRLIAGQTLRPVGARRDVAVDVRLLAGSSRALRAEVDAGGFLRELFEELAGIELYIPPLRERRDDIPLLIQHFLQKHAAVQERRRSVEFSPDAISVLAQQDWPGNVRQLESFVQRALVLARGLVVGADEIDLLMATGAATSPHVFAGTDAHHEPAAGPTDTPPTAVRFGPFRSLNDHEKMVIREALIRTRGNKSAAAQLLGVHRNTLARKIQIMELESEVGRKRRPKRRGRS